MSNKTSLSASIIIGEILNNEIVGKGLATKAFPVCADAAVLPYVRYYRTDFLQQPVKNGPVADTVVMCVDCYAADYSSGVLLAEDVRAALDHRAVKCGDLTMRSCTLTKSSESWENDAFIQTLIFNVKI